MNPQTTLKTRNYFNVFPKNRDFYFLDSYEKLKDFYLTNFEDPEYICIISINNEKQIKEGLYKRKDFLEHYEFIKAIEKDSNIDLNFIISKNKINIGGSSTRLLTEIKSRPLLMKEIYRRSKINFNISNNLLFKEEFSVPNDLKFYNRVFKIHVQKANLNDFQNNQNQANNNNLIQFNSFKDENITVEFIYNSQNKIPIYSKLNERFEEICSKFALKINKDINKVQLIYSGKYLNTNNKLITLGEIINKIDNERKMMSIIALDISNESTIINKKNIIKANQVICPRCQESARINFENFQIKIYDCKNQHTSYLLLNEYEDSQTIDESKIFCSICKENNKNNTYNKLMYICNHCKIFLCPLCLQNHDKTHNIINYEQKYYICEIHNRAFNSYCKSCKKDICVLCESEHEKHEVISYSKIIPKIDLLNNSKNMMKIIY